jgi:hypothetical protein
MAIGNVSVINTEETSGIASLGYWADKDVSVAAAARQGAPMTFHDAKSIAPWRQLSELNTGPSAYVLCQEAKVRGKVGDDIRWDVVLEQAETLLCGLPAVPKAPAKQLDDAASTSAGSETNSNSVEFETPGSPVHSPSGSSPGSEKDAVFVAPWRRQSFLLEASLIDNSPASGSDSEAISFPWRREASPQSQITSDKKTTPAAATSQRYSASLLLQLRRRQYGAGDSAEDLLPKTMDEDSVMMKNAPWKSKSF